MNEKICAVCQIENEPHFTYCKHCGASLPVVERIPKETPVEPEEKHNFGSVSYYDFYRFIGNGAENILHDFEKLDKGNRFVFSLPVLFLGFVFGFYGIASWFFYRNLKKFGFILLGLGALFSLVDAFANIPLSQSFLTEISRLMSGRINTDTFVSTLSGLVSYYSYYYLSVSKYLGFFASFFASAVCLGIYKKEATRKICFIKDMINEEDPILVNHTLKKEGGTNLALAIVPYVLSLALPILFLAVALI